MFSVVRGITEEELIKRSPRGQGVAVLLNFLKSIENKSLTDIAISNVNNCLLRVYPQLHVVLCGQLFISCVPVTN